MAYTKQNWGQGQLNFTPYHKNLSNMDNQISENDTNITTLNGDIEELGNEQNALAQDVATLQGKHLYEYELLVNFDNLDTGSLHGYVVKILSNRYTNITSFNYSQIISLLGLSTNETFLLNCYPSTDCQLTIKVDDALEDRSDYFLINTLMLYTDEVWDYIRIEYTDLITYNLDTYTFHVDKNNAIFSLNSLRTLI